MSASWELQALTYRDSDKSVIIDENCRSKCGVSIPTEFEFILTLSMMVWQLD